MWQILFRIPGPGSTRIPIFGYGLMLFLSFLASMNLAAWRARREKINPEIIYDLAFWVFLGGLLGARAFYVWEYWGVRIHTFWDIFKLWEGGIVFYGSVLGATAGLFFYRAMRPFPLGPVLDSLAPAIALGIAIGRIGCFLNGCCYGDMCDAQKIPWAVTFPRESAPWVDQVKHGLIPLTASRSLPVHPTQLYSALDGLILVVLLSAFYPLRKRDGEVMALLMMTYPVSRFLIERLRNDEPAAFAGLTISQNISILLLACGVVYWFSLQRRAASRYADTIAVLE
jgi:phosphatidylglycerol:prolipoprotein diacylglycerol transferase